jgi:phage shock protein C
MGKKLTRLTGKDAMFLGICAGIGKYFDIDPTLVRVATAIATFFSFGSMSIVYFIMAFIIPKEEQNSL